MRETGSTGFELRRHFFARFFDSDLVATPGQWKIVAAGLVAVVFSLALIFAQAYYAKYGALKKLDVIEPYRMALLADALFLICLAMLLTGLFTTLLWPNLFPGLRDYMTLASLPIRTRQIFLAKFAALFSFAAAFAASIALLPGVILPMVVAGRYATHSGRQIAAVFLSMFLSSLLVFFTLAALQGLLLNLTPVRLFPRLSLAAQGLLLTLLLMLAPAVLKIPNWHTSMHLRPDWMEWAPPLWFLGLHQVVNGNAESAAVALARLSAAGLMLAALICLATYYWSYRRHRVRLLECPAETERAAGFAFPERLVERLLPEQRSLAVFAFIGKTLGRSRTHRLVVTAFLALALAAAFEGLLTLSPVSVPLTFSFFLLTGFAYLFRLPVELRANWLFRMLEPGWGGKLVAGAEKFLLYAAIVPVVVGTLPVLLGGMGLQRGLIASLYCLVASLTLMELLLTRFHKVPFTCGYLPGRRPLIETLVLYGVAVTLFVSILGMIIGALSGETGWSALMLALWTGLWWRFRTARLEDSHLWRLEFEELEEISVQTLSIERD